LENPEIYIAHEVNQEFHYWKDIVNHLAPAKWKVAEGRNLDEIPEVLENDWIQPVAEKEFAVQLCQDAILKIKEAKPYFINAKDYNILYHTFNRTLLTAKLRKAYATLYYSNRIWNRGEEFQQKNILNYMENGIEEIEEHTSTMKLFSKEGPTGGQWEWKDDIEIALELAREIRNSGVPVFD
jgi:hypothetical protein